MKCRISFALCGALMGIISLLGANAGRLPVREEDEGFHECAGIYLKSKGKVEFDVLSFKKFTESECMLAMEDRTRSLRNDLENLVKIQLPNVTESTCVMAGFDKIQFIEFTLQVFFVSTDSSLPQSKRHATIEAMTQEKTNPIESFATKCGIDDDRHKSFMMFFS